MASPSEAVTRATSGESAEIDYGAVFEVIDHINGSQANIGSVITAVKERLQNPDEHVQSLSLQLLQACVKNENTNFHAAIASDSFMEVLSGKATTGGSGVAEQALALVQQLGCEAQLRSSMPIFRTYYTTLAQQGMSFPVKHDRDVEPLFTPIPGQPSGSDPTPTPSHSTAPPGLQRPESQGTQPESSIEGEHTALLQHLSVLETRVGELALSVSREEVGDLLSDDTFLDLLDFVEQCHPRLSLLLEAGSRGLLQGEAFDKVLTLNEPVARVINAAKVRSGLAEVPAGYTMANFDVSDLASGPPAAAVGGGEDPSSGSPQGGGDGDLLGLGSTAAPVPTQGGGGQWASEMSTATPPPAPSSATAGQQAAAAAAPPAVPQAQLAPEPAPAPSPQQASQAGETDEDDFFAGVASSSTAPAPSASTAPPAEASPDPFEEAAGVAQSTESAPGSQAAAAESTPTDDGDSPDSTESSADVDVLAEVDALLEGSK